MVSSDLGVVGRDTVHVHVLVLVQEGDEAHHFDVFR